MVNSRNKGKVGERQARDAAKSHWYAGESCIRAAQSNGKFSEDLLNALPGFHVEVKWYKQIGCLKWLRRALLDSKGGPAVVLMRENNDTKFYVLMRIEDSSRFADTLWHARNNDSTTPRPKPQKTRASASGTTPASLADLPTTSPSTATDTPTASPRGAESTPALRRPQTPNKVARYALLRRLQA